MNIVLSYSGGRDSILALHKMKEQGHVPVALLVMHRAEAGRPGSLCGDWWSWNTTSPPLS